MNTLQTSFISGELAPSLHGRVDTEDYHAGLKTCKNFIVQPHGGVRNRPGMEFIGSSKDHTKKARLIPFAFSTTQTYALEFGDLYMRVIKDGGHVLESTFTITGATQADPVVITTSAAHSYSNGDEVFIDDVVGMTELNGKRYIVANQTATTFELTGIDGTGYTAYSSGGTVARIFTLTTTYLEADLRRLKFTQSADVMVITHPSYQQRELTRTDHDAWTLTTLAFTPEIAAPTGESATGSGTNSYKVTAVAEETWEESLPTAAIDGGATPVTITWTDPGSGIERWNVYKLDNGLYGYIGSTETNSFIDDAIAPDLTDNPPKARDPYDATDNYPSCVAYYEQRLGFANTNNAPQTFEMTQIGHYKNMNRSLPIQDDDAISFTINSNQVNEVRHLVPLDDLIALTQGGEWKISSGGQPFTPSTVSAKQQGSFGSSHVPPVTVGDTVLFVQEAGDSVRDLAYVLDAKTYKGANLSVRANHLFFGKEIVEMAYAKRPSSVVWCVMDDGTLLGLTYVKELGIWGWHQHDTDGLFESVCSIKEGGEDAVYFVVNRTIGGNTKRYIERLHTRVFNYIEDAFHVDSGKTYDEPVTITGVTQADPVVITATAHDFSNGDEVRITHVDGMQRTNDDGDLVAALNQYYFIVNNVTANTFELQDLNSNDLDGTGYTAYVSGGEVRKTVKTLSLLDHLEGELLAVLADGSVQPNVTVSNGSVTLQRKASEIHIGLPYIADLETLDIVAQVEAGGQAKKKVVTSVTLKVEKSRGFWAGPNEDQLTEKKQRTDEDYGVPTRMTTGTQKLIIKSGWNSNGRILVRQVDPLPLSVLAIIPEVVVGD